MNQTRIHVAASREDLVGDHRRQQRGATDLLSDDDRQLDTRVDVQGAGAREPSRRIAEVRAEGPVGDQVDPDALDPERGRGRGQLIRDFLVRPRLGHLVAAVRDDVDARMEPDAG